MELGERKLMGRTFKDNQWGDKNYRREAEKRNKRKAKRKDKDQSYESEQDHGKVLLSKW